MTELSILLHPDPRLKKISIQVTNIDERIKKLCLDMIDTMYNHSGVGLAAPQVGVLKRVVVMDCSDDGEKSPVTLINPEIVWSSEFTDISGISKERYFKGLWATCIQHEIDHLNGKLFIDYLGPIKRSFITKRMKKYKKEIIKK